MDLAAIDHRVADRRINVVESTQGPNFRVLDRLLLDLPGHGNQTARKVVR